MVNMAYPKHVGEEGVSGDDGGPSPVRGGGEMEVSTYPVREEIGAIEMAGKGGGCAGDRDGES